MTLSLPECVSLEPSYHSESALLSRLEALKRENSELKSLNSRLTRDIQACTKNTSDQDIRLKNHIDDLNGTISELQCKLVRQGNDAAHMQHRIHHLQMANHRLERTVCSLKDKLVGACSSSLEKSESRKPAHPVQPPRPVLKTLPCESTLPMEHDIDLDQDQECHPSFTVLSPTAITSGLSFPLINSD